MTAGIGIALAFVAMLCWGVGDFSIQRSARKLGDWETLFVITGFGTLILLPFVYDRIPSLLADPGNGLYILIASGLILTAASVLDFEGLKKGKLAVIEPLWSIEIPAASFLAFFVLGDRITGLDIVLIVLLIFGLCLVSFKEKRFSHKFFLEKGVIVAICGAFLMGGADFFLGWGSRVTDPIMANFVLNVVMALISGAFLFASGRIFRTVGDLRANKALLLIMSICDNVAWIAYAFAMTIVPIAVATGLSESSVIVAVLLGLFANKEKLHPHQKVGLVLAILAAIALASVTSA